VRVVSDGAQALDFVFANGEFAHRDISDTPALILLDLKLPRIDGLEVVRRLRGDERTRLLPIVVLTASKQEEDLARSYAAGANAYVRKPVDYAEFAKAANVITAFWVQLNELPPREREAS
jgi:two-component system response regulator